MKTFDEALRATLQGNASTYGPKMESLHDATDNPLYVNFIRMAATTVLQRIVNLPKDDDAETISIICGVLAATFNTGVLVGIEMEKP